MDPHSDSQLLPVRPVRIDEPLLSINGSSNGTFCARKRDEESVALAVDFITAVLFERVAQQTSVQVQSFRVSFRAELPQSARRALDIAEQHGDGARRLASHARHYRADPARREEAHAHAGGPWRVTSSVAREGSVQRCDLAIRIADETEPRATLANVIRLAFGLDALLLEARWCGGIRPRP